MPTFSLSQSRDYSESEKDVYSVGSDTEAQKKKNCVPFLIPFFCRWLFYHAGIWNLNEALFRTVTIFAIGICQ